MADLAVRHQSAAFKDHKAPPEALLTGKPTKASLGLLTISDGDWQCRCSRRMRRHNAMWRRGRSIQTPS